jgi:hypothetical protein
MVSERIRLLAEIRHGEALLLATRIEALKHLARDAKARP